MCSARGIAAELDLLDPREPIKHQRMNSNRVSKLAIKKVDGDMHKGF